MEGIVDYMPTDIAVLRTLKSEITVDIPDSTSGRLFREDPSWLYEGRWGLVRFVPGPFRRLSRPRIEKIP
jgi:hypothetical protein